MLVNLPPLFRLPSSPLPSIAVSYLMAFPWRTPDVIGGSGCLIHVHKKLGVRILYLANFLSAWRLATQMHASGEIVWDLYSKLL